MGGDVSHRNRLARREYSELRRIGYPARRSIRLECRSACITHTNLTADPGSADIDGVARPAFTWLIILEQMQHVLGADEGPVGQQSVVFVRQSAPATDGDQPRSKLFREDRHTQLLLSTSQRRGLQHERAGQPTADRPSPVGRDVLLESRCGDLGGRYWVRTSDLFGVKQARRTALSAD